MATILEKAAEGSIFRRELMKDDYVNIKFASSKCETITAETKIEGYHGQTYVLMGDYIPSYDLEADCFRYDVTFRAWYHELENKLIKLFQKVGDEDAEVVSAEWSMMDTPAKYAELLKANGVTVSLDSRLTEDGTMYPCTFSGTSLLDAIAMITKAFDPDTNYWEWWFEGTTLNIGKLGESGSGDGYALGDKLANISVQEGTVKPITKLYAFSAARNMSSRYGKTFGSINVGTPVYASENTDSSVSREVLGYCDPNKIVTGRLFSSSARMKQRLSYHTTASFATLTLTEGNPVSYIVFPSIKENEAKNGKAEITFTNEYLGLLFDKKEASIEDKPCVFTAYLVVTSKNADGSYSDVAVIDKVTFSLTGTQVISSLKLEPKQFTTIEKADYNLVIRFEIKELNGEGVKITQNGNAGYEIHSLNYAYNAGTLGTFNPGYYPSTDRRSRCFSGNGTINGNEEAKACNLVLGKLPKAWFSNDKIPSLITTEQRLCAVVGEGNIEGQVIFDDIFPSMSGTIGEISIHSEEEKDTNGELTGNVLNYCSFFCDFLKDVDTEDFTEDTAKIIFDDGQLKGIEFDLHVASTDSNGTTFCIVPKEDYNIILPCEGFMPKSGDKYKIVGIDAAYYEDGDIIATAQTELENRANDYLKSNNANQNVYTCRIMPTVAVTDKPSFGSAITLSDIPLSTRVIGIQHPLDLPEADYQVICGNSPSYKRLSALETKTLSLK